MKLQEKAFMIDLIKRNYRRRANFLFLETILIFVGFTAISSVWILSNNDIICWSVAILSGISILTGMFLILFRHKPIGLEEVSPKGIKEAQLKALEECRHADFEELIHSIPLKEYFEI